MAGLSLIRCEFQERQNMQDPRLIINIYTDVITIHR